MGGGDGGDQRVGISVQLWVGFRAAGIIVGERVWGARRGEVGGDEGPVLEDKRCENGVAGEDAHHKL